MSDEKNKEPVLPADPEQAVKKMIDITKKLNAILDREAMSLATKDAVMFSSLQDDKAKVSQQYQAIADEFSARVNQFRIVDQELLNELERLQSDLKTKATSSQNIMQGLVDRFKDRLIVEDADKPK